MFTGLVEEKGVVKKIENQGIGLKFTFEGKVVTDDLKIGSSVACNGVCLTVIEKNENTFAVEVMEETLKKSDLGDLKVNDFINFERPLKADDRLGGHFVLGHVDTTGVVAKIDELSNSHFMRIEFNKEFRKYLIFVGSVAIDGISMTVAEVGDDFFCVGIIPHTWEQTVFSNKKIGDKVNLEFDVLGKYIEQIAAQPKL